MAGASAVRGFLNRFSVEITRPANTTAYTALDVINASPAVVSQLVAGRIARGQGIVGSFVVGAKLTTDQKGNTAQFKLHLYHTAPTAIADNAPYTLLYADVGKRIGSITLPHCATEDATNSTAAEAQDFNSRMPIVFDVGSRRLYVVLETLESFTPASGQKFTLEMFFAQN